MSHSALTSWNSSTRSLTPGSCRSGRRGTTKSLDLRLGSIHRTKLTSDAVDTLGELGLTTEAEDGWWVGMHPALSDVYLCALTAELAASGHNTPITDQPMHHVAATGWTYEDLSRALLPEADLRASDLDADAKTTDAHDVVITVALQSFAVRNLANVPVKRIIALREDHRDEFLSFRNRLDKIAGDTAYLAISDPMALLNQVETRYHDEVEADLRKLRKELHHERFETINTVMTISTPTSIAAAILTDIATAGITTATTTAFAIWRTGRKLREERAAIRAGHASAWLLRVDETLTPRGLVDHLGGLASRFTG